MDRFTIGNESINKMPNLHPLNTYSRDGKTVALQMLLGASSHQPQPAKSGMIVPASPPLSEKIGGCWQTAGQNTVERYY